MPYKFDQDIALTRLGDGCYQAGITADWNIAAPNGGYLLAIAGNALGQTFDCECPLSMTAYFHRPAAVGPAELRVNELSSNARLRTATVALVQEDRPVVTFVGAFQTGKPFAGPTHVRCRGEQIPPFEQCTTLTEIPFSFFDQVQLSLPPDQLTWIQGETTDEMRFTGYFEFTDGRPMDALAALLFIDATPPPILRHTGPLSWVPTIELTVQIRGVPTGQRVKFLSQTNYATQGIVETDLELFTESGDIVALSRQLAVVKQEPSA